jgi:replicative DNA helicase
VTEEGHARLNSSWLDQLIQPTLDDMEAGSRDDSYVRSGIADLDSLTRGVRCGELWTVGGRSGVGKTVLATNLLRSCTVEQGRRGLLVSRRESAQQTVRRFLCAEARVPLHSAATGTMTNDDWARLARRTDDVSYVLLELAEVGELDVQTLDGHLTFAHASDVPRIRLLVVDDVAAGANQLATLTALQELARAHQVGVLAVVEEEVERSALQQRSVEQVADIAVRIYRDDQDNADSTRAGEMDLTITRNKRGPVTKVTVAFQGHYGRIVDLPQ